MIGRALCWARCRLLGEECPMARQRAAPAAPPAVPRPHEPAIHAARNASTKLVLAARTAEIVAEGEHRRTEALAAALREGAGREGANALLDALERARPWPGDGEGRGP